MFRLIWVACCVPKTFDFVIKKSHIHKFSILIHDLFDLNTLLNTLRKLIYHNFYIKIKFGCGVFHITLFMRKGISRFVQLSTNIFSLVVSDLLQLFIITVLK